MEEPKLKKQECSLEQVLGICKNDPLITLWQNTYKNELHVYIGLELLEIVPRDKHHLNCKLLIARLYNAGWQKKALKQIFGTDLKTMNRWSEALKSGDIERLNEALRGQGAKRKLTSEIKSYVRMRFKEIYGLNRYSYSKQIRREVEEIFGEPICAETLRPLFKELKQCQYNKEENTCEGVAQPSPLKQNNRNHSPIFEQKGYRGPAKWCYHLGVLIFSEIICELSNQMGEAKNMCKQWLCALLLHSVNIEQSKLLAFDDLKCLLGQVLSSRWPQRQRLGELANEENLQRLFNLNSQITKADEQTFFYFDPHSKHYTGMSKILKGWCPSIHMADKVLHGDFFHTLTGQPVYFEHNDNYADLRERFLPLVSRMRNCLGISKNKTVTIIVDRGIYALKKLKEIIADKTTHIITWEKNYKPISWTNPEAKFILQRYRNNAQDIRSYQVEYIEETWEKEKTMRLFRVQITTPRKTISQLGILTDNPDVGAVEAITAMLSRWCEENDFKYGDKHFGLQQITSYAIESYEQIQKSIEDKAIKSGAYKAMETTRREYKKQCAKLLYAKRNSKKKNPKRDQKIADYEQKIRHLTEQLCETEKEMSRLEHLIREGYWRLDTRKKTFMDILRVIARNAFYQQLEPFKKSYNNYRDDHDLFRSLTQSAGIIQPKGDQMHVYLIPTPNYAPAIRKKMQKVLENLNEQSITMPDGSGRKIVYNLGIKSGIQIAI